MRDFQFFTLFSIFVFTLNADKNEHPNSKNAPKFSFQWNSPISNTRIITLRPPPTTPTTPATTPPTFYPLKKPARQALKNTLRGVTPEKRKKQLKSMGKTIKIKKINKNESKKLHKTYRKVNVTENPPALDMYDVNQRAGLNDYLFQGDINLDSSQLSELEATCDGSTKSTGRKKRQIQNSARFWPENTVNFYFDTSISANMQNIVLEAMNFIQSRTCIKFNRNSTATNRVKIFNGGGCYSNIGMIGGEQTLSLGSGCELVGTAAHELSHTLGVFHSQMRYDRDDFVTVDLSDVPSDSQLNFVKFTPTTSTNLVAYEYGSFMHYSGKAFVTPGGVDSIVPSDPLMVYTMGSRIVSFLDIQMLNTHYSCSCPAPFPECSNGGYPNPADCSKCVCPYSFGGSLCSDKANYTCGSALSASATWQSESFSFGNSSNSVTARANFVYCNHWITAPVGKVIEFRIDSTYNTQCGYGCTFNGIEPKLKKDVTVTQTRYCCDEFNGEVMTSETNLLPVFSFNRYYITKYTFSYRYVDAPTTACLNVSDKETCSSLKASYENGCSLYDLAQLKVMCAVTMGLCGKTTSTDCADRFSESQCSKYSSTGMCSSQSALVSEFSCAATCGYCTNPV